MTALNYDNPARPQVGDEATIVIVTGHKVTGQIDQVLPDGLVRLKRRTIQHAAACPCTTTKEN